MSIYSAKAAQSGIQPWSEVLPFGKGIRDFYESRGDVIVSEPTQIFTLLDGPEKVVRYGALTVSSTLTASQRCKGLTIVCDSLTVQGSGNISMSAKGPKIVSNDDLFFPFNDYRIPDQITLSSSLVSKTQALELIKAKGLAPWDQGTWQPICSLLYGFNLSIPQPGQTVLAQATGCGSGSAQQVYNTYANGATGVAGVNGGCGSGGHGGLQARTDVSGYYASHGKAGAGNPYGGGNGSSGLSAGNGYGNVSDDITVPASWVLYSWKVPAAVGAGAGGAGVNPATQTTAPWGGSLPGAGGDGVGGRLTIICFGAVNVLSGGKIESNGMPGGAASGTTYGTGGGGSGGGCVVVITPTTGHYANAGTVQAAGGAGGAGPYGSGGAGGAGSVVTKTFTQMGW